MRTVPRGLEDFERSLGWGVYNSFSSNSGDLLGTNTYGHNGYTGTSIVIDPDNGVSVILLTNSVHPKDEHSVAQLRSLVANIVAASVYSKR